MKIRLSKDDFLYLLIIVFVFISTLSISITKRLSENNVKPNVLSATSQKEFPDNPVLKDNSSFPLLSAQGVLAQDLNSGVPLYEKNSDGKLLPASTTKIITALVSLDTYKLDQVLTVPKGVSVDGQKMGLYTGEKMTVENLLYGLLVYSANDAAMTLAMDYPVATNSSLTGYELFINAMNEKAKSLYMINSHFENPVGLDGPTQITTARDLLLASEVAMRNPVFSKIVNTKSITISDATGNSKYFLNNVNELLGEVQGVAGIKTGWTENARENLVTYIERNGHKVIIVVLGSQDRFGETKELINWIFTNFEWQKVQAPVI